MDIFVKNHLDALKGQLCVSIAKAIKHKQTSSADKDTVTPIGIIHSNDDPERIELDRSQRQSQRLLLSRNRNNASILNPLYQANAGIPIFPNGSDDLKEKRKMVELINTCSFDSIVSVYACLYFDYDGFRNITDQNVLSDFSHLLQLMHQQRCIDKSLEQIRYKILKTIFTNTSFLTETSRLIHISCKTTMNFMHSRLCSYGNEFIASQTENMGCASCGQKNEIHCNQINVNLDTFNLRDVQNSIETQSDRQCRNCLRLLTRIDIEYNAIVAIDTEQIHFGHQNIRYAIDDVSRTIRLNEEDYEFFAAIEYQSDLEHYVAHIKRRSDQWYTYDDLVGRHFACDTKKDISIYMIFFKKKEIGK